MVGCSLVDDHDEEHGSKMTLFASLSVLDFTLVSRKDWNEVLREIRVEELHPDEFDRSVRRNEAAGRACRHIGVKAVKY